MAHDQSTDKLLMVSGQQNKASSAGLTRGCETANNPYTSNGKNLKLLPSRAPARRHSFHCKDQDVAESSSR